ncbi:unnamed protein product [Camellia sinensis]
MQSSSSSKAVCRQILRYQNHIRTVKPSCCDVFINHRRIDTNKNVAGLIDDELVRLKLRPFLDSKSMKPGDKLFDKINEAIRDCKVGIAVVGRRLYGIPIFVDVKPSELWVINNGSCPAEELVRFKEAVEEAKHTVGLTFDSSNGDWSELVRNASRAVMMNMLEVEGDRVGQKQMYAKYC